MAKKVIAFDLDGTLSISKSPANDRMVNLLGRLLENYHVCVISGGKIEQFHKQLLANLHLEPSSLEKLHLMPTCGTRYYVYDITKSDWRQVYAEDFTEDQKVKIIAALNDAMDEVGVRPKKHWGELIEDRGSQVTLSVLGQEAPVEAKDAWDPNDKVRYVLRDAIARRIPEFEVRAGGMTSMDVTKLGIDKSYGMNKLIEMLDISKDDILFMGDKLQEGGNDYPVKNMGIDSIEVRSWEDTAYAIEGIVELGK